jgi:plasmid stabilization system protein ParE
VSGRLVERPSARQELITTARYLRLQSSPEQAVRFLRDAGRTFAVLAGNPGIGTPYVLADPRLAELRYFPLSRFKSYLVFDCPIAGGIEVWHVLHGARDYEGILAEDFGDDEDDLS